MSLITCHHIYSLPLTVGKRQQLEQMLGLLSKLRSLLWQRYGSTPRKLAPRAIRDFWVQVLNGQCQSSDVDFVKTLQQLPARLWKATLQDVLDNINARNEACRTALARRAYRSFGKQKAKSLLSEYPFETADYRKHPVLHRWVRQLAPKGFSRKVKQLVLDSGCYRCFEQAGRSYLAMQGLVAGQRIIVPLTCLYPITGTLRTTLNADGSLTISLPKKHPKPTDLVAKEHQALGVDKGYSEVFTDSEGNRYGEGLGKVISEHSDRLKSIYQARNKLFALACKYDKSNPAKATRIRKHNLGRQKLDRQAKKHKDNLKTLVYTACNQLARKTQVIAVEDLNFQGNSNNYGKDQTRRLNSWVKGLIQTAITSVSKRHGVSLHVVNAAYTSQADGFGNHLLQGERKGNRFYRVNGDVVDADHNAAKNILARLYDTEIQLWHSKQIVKEILLKRLGRSVETVQPVL